jgi:hypothetical protein
MLIKCVRGHLLSPGLNNPSEAIAILIQGEAGWLFMDVDYRFLRFLPAENLPDLEAAI